MIAHRDLIVLAGCTFVVQPAGLRKVRETGVKNVHAFVRGTEVEAPGGNDVAHWWQVRYNPHVHDTFMRVMYMPNREQPIHEAKLVICEIHHGCPRLLAFTPRKG